MWYEWDEGKCRANQVKHGIDFQDVLGFQWDTALEIPDERKDHGEPRWIALGLIGSRLHTLVFTKRNDGLRVISLRKSNPREEGAYEFQKK